ncbi:MAG: NADH-quinone oxidoreductase subunit L, partial [Acidobacteria bacterium]|nr:NADH-quinone oxidoreductase subunit L [Acidobacteriota bacterium]
GLEHFLEPVFEHQAVSVAAPGGGTGLEMGLTAISVLVALLGMGIAYYFYLARPQLPGLLAHRFRALYNTLYHKYYVDEIYDTLIVHPTEQTSRSVLWKGIDVSVIDGVVNGVGSLFQEGGDFLRRMQSGYARAYATWILFGAFIILLYFVARY